MVYNTKLTPPQQRKQRIEGIVHNLSSKIQSNDGDGHGGSCDKTSFHLLQRRNETFLRQALTPSYTSDLAYSLPEELQFAGITCVQSLPKGKQYGPFDGKIIPAPNQQYPLRHTSVCQVPDLNGNECSLYLGEQCYTGNWLRFIQKWSLDHEYNVVAYNTPQGVMLELIKDIEHGSQLLVVYDQSRDVVEGSNVLKENVIPVITDFATAEMSSQRRILPYPTLDSTGLQYSYNGNSIVNDSDEITSEMVENEQPYLVLTADVTEELLLRNKEKKFIYTTEKRYGKSTRISFTNIKQNEKSKKNYVPLEFRCEVCKKLFNTVEDRQQHMDISHSGECPICQKTYSRTYLKEHILYHMETNQLTCDICGKVFSSKSNLRKHELKHSKNTQQAAVKKQPAPPTSPPSAAPVHKCTCCPQTFDSENELQTHVRKHGRQLPIKCAQCNETFSLRSHLRRHKAVVHLGKKTYPCRICRNTFTQKGNLVRHFRLLHSQTKEVRPEKGPLRFHCRRRGCVEGFSTREQLVKHLEKHTGRSGVFSCDICNGLFSSASNLKKHMSTLHAQKKTASTTTQAKPSCELCNKEFPNEYILRRHMRSHKNKKANRCVHCNHVFATSSGLGKHIRLQRCTVMKERKASIKQLKTSSLELKAHRSLQDIPDHPVCDICGKCFSKRGNLAKHKRNVHFDLTRSKLKDKAVRCDICNRAFRNAGSLELHRRVHQNRKSVKCDYCDRRFSNMGGRKKHMMSCVLTVGQSKTDVEESKKSSRKAVSPNGETKPRHKRNAVSTRSDGTINSLKIRIKREPDTNLGPMHTKKYKKALSDISTSPDDNEPNSNRNNNKKDIEDSEG